MSIPGGWSPEAPANGEVVCNCLAVQSDIEKAAGTGFPCFIPISFRLQIVAGKNFLVKVAVNLDKCVFVMIFQALNGGDLTVKGVQYPKSMSDILEPF